MGGMTLPRDGRRALVLACEKSSATAAKPALIATTATTCRRVTSTSGPLTCDWLARERSHVTPSAPALTSPSVTGAERLTGCSS